MGDLIALRAAEKAEDLPLPYDVKLMISEPLAVKQDCQVYLKLKKIPEGITGSWTGSYKSWSKEGRCPLSYSSCDRSVENQELRKALKDLKLRLNACFIADVSDFIDQSDLSLLPRLEAIGCQLELSGFTMRLGGGIRSSFRQADVLA